MHKLFRPVKGERNKDWRFTQERWANPEIYKKIGWPYHMWLDYAWPKQGDKVPVFSAEAWTVLLTWFDKDWFWNYIVIEGASWYCYYAHLDRIDVLEWQQVNHNSQIWIMGTTGNSTWVHLHFGWKPYDIDKVVRGGRWNPTPFISDRTINEFEEEYKILQDEWIWNGELWWMDPRMLTIVARVFKSLKK